MFHVVTVHWNDERCIAPQLRYLERNVDDFDVYATLNGIPASTASSARVVYTDDFDGTHAEKLNHLAEVACERARPDDLLMFLDGDAFPIALITPAVLGGTPLAAVRRDENLGQRQPHPCFCVTSVKFWCDIDGDWRAGHSWVASNGVETTDTGGNLLGLLEARGVEWRALTRTNRTNLDPLWFAIYGDVVYHHGAGFRAPVTFRVTSPSHARVVAAAASTRAPAWLGPVARAERSLRYRLASRRERRAHDAYLERARARSAEVFHDIETDPEFYRRFLAPPADGDVD